MHIMSSTPQAFSLMPHLHGILPNSPNTCAHVMAKVKSCGEIAEAVDEVACRQLEAGPEVKSLWHSGGGGQQSAAV